MFTFSESDHTYIILASSNLIRNRMKVLFCLNNLTSSQDLNDCKSAFDFSFKIFIFIGFHSSSKFKI